MSDPGLEIAKEAAKAAAVAVVSPAVAIVADILNGTVGDRLSNWRKSKPAWRERNARETLEAAAKIMVQRKIETPADEIRPECIEEILTAAEETSAAELKQLYANLIAAIVDPQRSRSYRREFVDIIRKLEPFDAVVLPLLGGARGEVLPSRLDFVAARLEVSTDEVELSFRNLADLGLITRMPERSRNKVEPQVLALGRQFLSAAT